ncbi:MAG: endonuclease/exonuclease/phosphatase family protein [Chloroflexota bacterium]
MRLPLRHDDRSPDTLSALRNGLVGAGLAYAGGVLGYALVRPLVGQREGWLELVDDLEPWAYLPAPLLAALGVAIGSRSLAAAGLSVATLFGLRWGRRYLRRTPSVKTGSPPSELTVMTFNTLAWQREGRDLEASIRAARPDLVGLQEIGPTSADYLTETLADTYPYHYVTPSATSSGAAVLSRYPLHDAVSFRASEHGHWWQRMTVQSPAGPITYINIHTKIPYIRTTRHRCWFPRIPLQFHAQRRRKEVQELVAMLENVSGPVIVNGDFNMTERSPDYRMLARQLQDGYRAVGAGLGHTFPRRGSWPRTFPMPWPTLRLDYVWHSHHLAPAWGYRGDAGHSDHHPVIVGFRWAEVARHVPGMVPMAASAV